MHFHVTLPYPQTEEMLFVWANEEKNIDFRREKEKALRCTMSFAGTELVTYLKKAGHTVDYSDKLAKDAFNISLSALSAKDNECFSIKKVDNGLAVIGDGRVGILYGVYEFLRHQGIRFPNPYQEIVTPFTTLSPEPKEQHYEPSMPLGRGFDFEGPLKDSTKLWLWMARNGLNLSAYRPYTAAFQKKLGMSFKAGGHIFENILSPARLEKDGKPFIEAHPDWYGKRENEELTVENALTIQFCMSDISLLDFLGDELIAMLNGEWYYADRIDVWTFDTWGKTCSCEACRKLGNSTDATLHFLSHIRSHIDCAVAEGKLDHDVRLVMCAYEGTSTLEPPSKPIPENLTDGRDYVVFYPINRCYHHVLDDLGCDINSDYAKALRGWKGIPLMVGEYYNVSKFEDMPYLFTKTMPHDIRFYQSIGISGMTYMHLPIIEWGMRNSTQVLYASLLRDINTDTNALLHTYFADRYDSYAKQAENAYRLAEEAGSYCRSFRSWSRNCVLRQLLLWDGKIPAKMFYRDSHLNDNAIEIGKKSIAQYEESLRIMQDIRQKRMADYAGRFSDKKITFAVNPVEMSMEKKDFIVSNIDEDIRLLIYGKNIMLLTVLFLEYYNALLSSENTSLLWEQIDSLVSTMSNRYLPLRYVNSMENIELACDSEFERSQLRPLYYRCLAERMKT